MRGGWAVLLSEVLGVYWRGVGVVCGWYIWGRLFGYMCVDYSGEVAVAEKFLPRVEVPIFARFFVRNMFKTKNILNFLLDIYFSLCLN